MTETELTEARSMVVTLANERRDLAALAVLNKMMRLDYFTISPLHDLMSYEKRDKSRAYDTLLMIHCIHWEDIPERLRNMIPDLIFECVGIRPTYLYKPDEGVKKVISRIKTIFK